MADALVITKADSDNILPAQSAKAIYQNALHLYPPSQKKWVTQALTCSALTKEGIPQIWTLIEEYQTQMQANGFFEHNRRMQNLNWLHETIKQTLEEQFYNAPAIKTILPQIKKAVQEGKIPAMSAAFQLLDLYKTR